MFVKFVGRIIALDNIVIFPIGNVLKPTGCIAVIDLIMIPVGGTILVKSLG